MHTKSNRRSRGEGGLEVGEARTVGFIFEAAVGTLKSDIKNDVFPIGLSLDITNRAGDFRQIVTVNEVRPCREKEHETKQKSRGYQQTA